MARPGGRLETLLARRVAVDLQRQVVSPVVTHARFVVPREENVSSPRPAPPGRGGPGVPSAAGVGAVRQVEPDDADHDVAQVLGVEGGP